MIYAPLTLYYLKQLGIRPWVHTKNEPTLIIISPLNPDKKPALLLQAILAFIKRLELPFCVLELDFLNLNKEYTLLRARFQKRNPLAILSFGLDSTPFLQTVPQNCPVLCHVSLEALVQQKEAKKKTFDDLMALRDEVGSYEK